MVRNIRMMSQLDFCLWLEWFEEGGSRSTSVAMRDFNTGFWEVSKSLGPVCKKFHPIAGFLKGWLVNEHPANDVVGDLVFNLGESSVMKVKPYELTVWFWDGAGPPTIICVFKDGKWQVSRPERELFCCGESREFLLDWCAGTAHPCVECLMERLCKDFKETPDIEEDKALRGKIREAFQ